MRAYMIFAVLTGTSFMGAANAQGFGVSVLGESSGSRSEEHTSELQSLS